MKFITTVILIFQTLFVFSQNNWSKEMNLKAKVKSINLTEYQIDGTDMRKARINLSTSGNKLEEILLDNSGEILYKQTLEYNGNKILLEKIINNQLEDSNFNKKYVYDTKEKLTEIIVSGAPNRLFYKILYKYPNDTTEVISTHIEDDKIDKTITNTYNSKKQLIEEVTLDGNEVKKVLYSYNDGGKVIERKEFEQNVFTFQVDYKYDVKGNLISEESKYRNSDDINTVEYTYQYDAKGNWTNMQEKMDGRTYAITSRDLTYYK